MSDRVLIIFAFLITASYSSHLPSDIILCKNGDVECIPHAARDFVLKCVHGRRDLGVPSLDPFQIDSINVIQNSGGPVHLNLRIFNATLEGFSKVYFNKAVGFTTEPETSKFELHGNTTQLAIKGQYSVDGKISLLPIQGNGDITIRTLNTGLAIKFKPTVSTRADGRKYIQLDKLKVRVTTEKLFINFSNLFNGDKVLGDATNNFLNENWKTFWDEFDAPLNDVVARIVRNIVDSILDKYAYEDFFLPQDRH